MTTNTADFSAATQDYLKAVWLEQEWSQASVTMSALAQRMGLAVSSVSGAVKKLVAMGLLHHAPYRGVDLTPTGRDLAVQMVRRHRLIETFLVEKLGYAWDEVNAEAETLEHAVSDVLIDRLDALLGFPHRDPHGDPIPSRSGRISPVSASLLTAVEPGFTGVVARIRADEPSVLQYLERHELMPGRRVEVLSVDETVGVITVRTEGTRVEVGWGACERVWISRQDFSVNAPESGFSCRPVISEPTPHNHAG